MRTAAAVLVVSLWCLPASAQQGSEALDRQSYEMYQQVFSPFCPVRSLNDCPSSKAQDLKREMRAKLEAGVPQDEILSEVFARFGDKYRTVPLFEGIGKMVWIAPIAFALIGLAIAGGVVLRRKKGSPAPDSPSGTAIPEELQRRIDEELAKLD